MKKSERGDIVLILTIGTLVVLGVSSLVSLILPKTNQSTRTRAQDVCGQEGQTPNDLYGCCSGLISDPTSLTCVKPNGGNICGQEG